MSSYGRFGAPLAGLLCALAIGACGSASPGSSSSGATSSGAATSGASSSGG